MVKPFDLGKITKEHNKKHGVKDGFNDPITWVDTGNKALNRMISGDFNNGIPLGAVTVFAGESGCLPATAKVRVRHKDHEADVTVGRLRQLYHSDMSDIQSDNKFEIDTPDGWQGISDWFDKGVLPLVFLTTEAGFATKCAFNHPIQRADRTYALASELAVGDQILTRTGVDTVTSNTPAGEAFCYDFEVDHPNHRYWGDGISSHNSAKSYIVSGNLVRNALAMGINVVVIDSEDALKSKWVSKLGVDPNHPRLVKYVKNTVNEIVSTINDFTSEYRKDYLNTPREEQPKMLFVIDSLGFVETDASVEQFEKNDLKGDKGIKAKALKMLVSNCIRLFAGYEIGLVATNHTYKSQDMYSPDDVISGGCLVPGTKVWLANGDLKCIEDMEIGDVVRTIYGKQCVSNLWTYFKPTYRLELSDGQIIECSPEHKFLVVNDSGHQWKSAADIQETDEVLSLYRHFDPRHH